MKFRQSLPEQSTGTERKTGAMETRRQKNRGAGFHRVLR